MGEKPLRSVGAGTLRSEQAGEQVRVAGWVNARRDHGGVIFLDLRDASGIVQLVVDPEGDAGAVARGVRVEFCIAASGRVGKRPEDKWNPELPTGDVEVDIEELRVLSPAEPLPFQLDEWADVGELRRLEYRYLDLRRPRMAENIRARSRGVRAIRRVLDERGFVEVETPTLIRSTPEGARDMLVPSRLRPGSFYALPQSPQLFKQLLMIAGIERYYQIARCYRDEDFRADRQLEFTQLDLEGSFWGREEVLATLEAVMVEVVRELRGVTLETPFPRLAYAEAMTRYGTDKPDVRFGMEIRDLSDVFAGTGFEAFAQALDSGGTVRGFNAGRQDLSRAWLDGLVDDAKTAGARGLVWAIVEPDDGLRSPVARLLTPQEQDGLRAALDAAPGDLLLMVADHPRAAATVLGRLRLQLGNPPGHDELRFLWVVDFPVFEEGEDGVLVPSHHPFTAPVDVAEMRRHPERALAEAYDLVLNGNELGSGSVRIHDPEVQRQVFEILGIGPDEAERRFGWFVEALRFGTPPHAGFAAGIDRLFAIVQDEPSIREVIAFPKTQTGLDPLTDSPTRVADEQLEQLGIALRPEARLALEEDVPSRED